MHKSKITAFFRNWFVTASDLKIKTVILVTSFVYESDWFSKFSVAAKRRNRYLCKCNKRLGNKDQNL